MIATDSALDKAFRAYFETTFDSLVQSPDMHLSPTWEESALCASLRVWEATATGIAHVSKWKVIRDKYRKRAHPEHADWMLSDPSAQGRFQNSRNGPTNGLERSFLRVKKGMRQVYQQVLEKYKRRTIRSRSPWDTWARLTEELAERQFSQDPKTNDPEAYEASLLVLIQWLEWFLSHGATRQGSMHIWRTEIRKTRKFGPPSTKTFSTATSLQERLGAREHIPEAEIKASFKQLVRWMRRQSGG